MRRLSAILLLVLFSLPLIEPALVADADSKLPACCRRGGQHHCAMDGAASGGPAIQAVCPAFPKAGAAPAYSKAFGVRPAPVAVAVIATHPSGRAQTEARYQLSFSRARQKRGPPALLS